jgi:hypothetical protein
MAAAERRLPELRNSPEKKGIYLCTPNFSWVLTVNFCQTSHEFTFSVGIDLISKLMILTLIIYQVRTRMWFLKFIVYAGIKHLK